MEGSVALKHKWLREWPVSFPTMMFTAPLADGLLEAEALPDGAINIQVSNEEGSRIEVTSVPITFKSKLLNIAVAWKSPGSMTVFVNGVCIASLEARDLPYTAELPPAVPRKAIDFSDQNQQVRVKRRAEELRRVARPGLRLRTLEEEIGFLYSATLQLEELADALEKGLDYHLFGTLAIMRSLIARGGRNFQPLVQRVAGKLDHSLLLYAPFYENDPVSSMEIAPAVDYRFDITPESEIGDEAVIDLDVWLETPGIVKNNAERISQNEVIRLFADAAGSHFDPDATPDFDEIEAIKTYRQNSAVSVMVAYSAQIARCICHLGEQLILTARK